MANKIAPEAAPENFAVKDDEQEEVIVLGNSQLHAGHKMLRTFLRNLGAYLLFLGAFIAMISLNATSIQRAFFTLSSSS